MQESAPKSSRAYPALLIAVTLSLIIPWIPVVRWALIPFDYLNTFIHELCHAYAALISGGSVERIIVQNDAQGSTITRGGMPGLIFSAGYVGASLLGAALIQSRSPRAIGRILPVAAVIMALSLMLWVRGESIGLALSGLWCLLIFLLPKLLSGDQLIFAAQFLGVQQCVNAIKSLRDLILLTGAQSGANDAVLLGHETNTPPIMWALIWLAISLYGILSAVRFQRGLWLETRSSAR